MMNQLNFVVLDGLFISRLHLNWATIFVVFLSKVVVLLWRVASSVSEPRRVRKYSASLTSHESSWEDKFVSGAARRTVLHRRIMPRSRRNHQSRCKRFSEEFLGSSPNNWYSSRWSPSVSRSGSMKQRCPWFALVIDSIELDLRREEEVARFPRAVNSPWS
jgi:hypothetical protein